MKYFLLLNICTALLCACNFFMPVSGTLSISATLVYDAGANSNGQAISITARNISSGNFSLDYVELWFINGDGNIFPSFTTAARRVDIGEDIAAGETKEFLFILEGEVVNEDLGLSIRIIRVNGRPYVLAPASM